MSENIIEAVLTITGLENNEITRIRINSLLIEILAYLNRDEITDEIFYPIVTVIADCLTSPLEAGDNIQSYREGDMSVSFSNTSPFFGKLDSFKLIRGIN